jgi:FkbM family methyltransferase
VPELIQIRCGYALGDVVVLTAAVRDLARAFPGRFDISVDSKFPDVWRHNPYVRSRAFPGKVIDCARAPVDRTGATGRHYVHAYLDLLNERLGTNAEISEVKGDIHLSEEERNWYSDLWNLCGREVPFWLICSGGKFDIPIKWWDHQRYQQVVDALKGQVQFVQVGAWGNHHPPLAGAIDLRGQTSVRDLIHLVHHADGLVCGVTALMHLAAAVPARNPGRAAIVVAGNREPKTWEAYPGHFYLTAGNDLPCGNCWNGTFRESPKSEPGVCNQLRRQLPRCMDAISSEQIIELIHKLKGDGRCQFLSPAHRRLASRAVIDLAQKNTFDTHNVTVANAPQRAREFLATLPPYPAERYSGRGIVICAGGLGYFARAWVCIQMLRQFGCTLPIEIWHLGRAELDETMEALVRPFNVQCIDARRMLDRAPMRNPLGWELKCYAILHTRFREVLSLDADNVPTRNPEFLFEGPEYRATGAIFWPDYGRLGTRRKIWQLCEVPYRNEPEFESGQIVLDKERCWRALNLAWWYNDHSEFFYRHIHGDKDTFHMAWRRTNTPYSMPPYPIESLEGVMCQHDFTGRRIFQHRNSHKWSFFGENKRIDGFRFEDDCRAHLDRLRSLWNGTIGGQRECRGDFGATFRTDTVDREVFRSVAMHNEYALPAQFEVRDAILDIGAHIGSFVRACHDRGSREIHAFEAHPENFGLARKNVGALSGVNLYHGAVLNRSGRIACGPFTRGIGAQNTGGVVVYPEPGPVQCFDINEVIRALGYIEVLKLDCEGSEWPILFSLREWNRIEAICGEYHRDRRTPDFSPETLAALLGRHFPSVTVSPAAGNEQLGKFWASRVKGYFSNAHTRRQPKKSRNGRACF